MVLSNQFSQWYRPRPEQAGSQRGRSCEEQILVTRLLIDIARKSKLTLYDFQKAYDIVNRLLLFQDLTKPVVEQNFSMRLWPPCKSLKV